MPPQAPCPVLKIGTGGMRSIVISFCILVVSIALIVGAAAALTATI
jgi:hypothetical protein